MKAQQLFEEFTKKFYKNDINKLRTVNEVERQIYSSFAYI